MLQHFGVVPFLVFDGDYLPSKAVTETEREKRRADARKAGLELHQMGKMSQAYLEFQKAVDVSPEMAKQLINELKRVGVQFVVAPYEADAQLAYLERKGIISAIISEDSDLLVFGTRCLLTKLDQYGDCVEINRADFTACKDISMVGWSDVEFRQMAILSGCDYLPSINKMGLKTAYRLIRKYKQVDRLIRSIQFDGQFRVPTGYLEAFRQAELTFLYQRVFCPTSNQLVLNTDLEDGLEESDMAFIGQRVESKLAIGVARGDLHPMTKLPLEPRQDTRTVPPRQAVRRHPLRNVSDENSTPKKDSKGCRNIENFFKPNRTPLAELDPNSFTPSPHQRQTLQANSAVTWTSSPAPSRSRLPSTAPSISTAQPSALRSAPPVCRRVSVDACARQSLNGERPAKKPRLCAEDTRDLATPGTDDFAVARSRFFNSSASSASPTTRIKPPRRVRQDEFLIFSDDSLEEHLANLPTDNCADEMPSESRGEFKGQGSPPENVVKEPPLNTDRIRYPVKDTLDRKSVAVAATPTDVRAKTSEVPVDSLLGSTTWFNDHLLGHQTCASPIEASSLKKQSEKAHAKLGKVLRDDRAVADSRQPFPKKRNLTPLQKIGIGAIARVTSADLARSDTKRSQLLHGDDVFRLALEGNRPQEMRKGEKDRAVVGESRGSEDMIIPDSDDESRTTSDASGDEKNPSLDLTKYAFTPRKVDGQVL